MQRQRIPVPPAVTAPLAVPHYQACPRGTGAAKQWAVVEIHRDRRYLVCWSESEINARAVAELLNQSVRFRVAVRLERMEMSPAIN